MCGSPPTVENSERDGNTRPPDLPPEKTGDTKGTFHAKIGTRKDKNGKNVNRSRRD